MAPARVDQATVAYFDSHRPHYSLGRLAGVADFVAAHAGPGSSLLDVGCGVGDVVRFVAERSGATQLYGLDVSGGALQEATIALGTDPDAPWTFTALHGSILDPAFIAGIGRTFDTVIVSATLHHLLGLTRRRSKRAAAAALRHAASLVAPGGHLVVHEPLYEPRVATWGVFWLKRIVSAVRPARLGVGDYWANVGAPVVSYLDRRTFDRLIGASGLQVVRRDLSRGAVPRIARPVLRTWNATVYARSAPSVAGGEPSKASRRRASSAR